MRTMILLRCLVLLLVTVPAESLCADNMWSQFRGPNASGHADAQPSVPVEFGPEKNLLWRCELPRGLSSPCVVEDRIFVSAFDSTKAAFQVSTLR